MVTPRLSYSEIQKLTRWSTPSVFNGWEAVTAHERTEPWYNIEETVDFMPHMGPMAGFAVTVVAEPSNPAHPRANPDAWAEYRAYVAGIPGPKIVVVQDLDKPDFIGAFWGEVTSNVHKALGCVGTIIDGAIRDVDEMAGTGFKAIASRLCVGHAYSMPVRWGCDVEVFGCPVKPGFLVHADKHGFLVIPPEDERKMLEAVAFMDANECNTVIAAAKGAPGKSMSEILESLEEADDAFARAVEENFPGENLKKKGEWGKK